MKTFGFHKRKLAGYGMKQTIKKEKNVAWKCFCHILSWNCYIFEIHSTTLYITTHFPL